MAGTTGKLLYDLRYLTKTNYTFRFLSMVFGVWPQNFLTQNENRHFTLYL